MESTSGRQEAANSGSSQLLFNTQTPAVPGAREPRRANALDRLAQARRAGLLQAAEGVAGAILLVVQVGPEGFVGQGGIRSHLAFMKTINVGYIPDSMPVTFDGKTKLSF